MANRTGGLDDISEIDATSEAMSMKYGQNATMKRNNLVNGMMH